MTTATPAHNAAPRHTDPRVAAVVALFESLSPTDLPGLRGVYAPDARFKDPFNAVQGLPASGRLFDHLFRQLAGRQPAADQFWPSVSVSS